MNSVRSNNLSLKYQRFPSLQSYRVRKFVANTQFFYLSLTSSVGSSAVLQQIFLEENLTFLRLKVKAH